MRAFSEAECDVSDSRRVGSLLQLFRPEYVVNCVERFSWKPSDEGFRINSVGAAVVALGARLCGAYAVHVSDEVVFSGYPEEVDYLWKVSDRAYPTSVMGVMRLLGEQAVRELCTASTVVRLPYLYDHHYVNSPIVRAARTLRQFPEEPMRLEMHEANLFERSTPIRAVHAARILANHIVEGTIRSYPLAHIGPKNGFPISWKELLAGFYPDNRKAYHRQSYGLASTEGWEAPSMIDTLDHFLKEAGTDWQVSTVRVHRGSN